MKTHITLGEYLMNIIPQDDRRFEVALFIKIEYKNLMNQINSKCIKYYVAYLICLVCFLEWYNMSLYLNHINNSGLFYMNSISPFKFTCIIMFQTIVILNFTIVIINRIFLKKRRRKIESLLTQSIIDKYNMEFNDVTFVIGKDVILKSLSIWPYKISYSELYQGIDCVWKRTPSTV